MFNDYLNEMSPYYTKKKKLISALRELAELGMYFIPVCVVFEVFTSPIICVINGTMV